MTSLRCCGILSLGLFSAITALVGLAGCRSDEADAAQRGLSTKAMRANRVPARVVGEPENSNATDAGADHAGQRFASDAGSPPASPLKDHELLHVDGLSTRDTGGVVLDAEWRWSDVPGASNAGETSADALEVLRNGTRLRMRIEVATAGRLSIVFVGHGYPWPDGTELRARIDRLGHVLVWPDGKHYRIVVPGALRALFADRRLDRGLLFTPKVTIDTPGSAIGQATARQSLNTPIGAIQLEQATLAAGGIGAPLLCRFLVELVGVDPNTGTCAPDQLVLRANVMSAPSGKLQFVVNQWSRKQDLPLAGIQLPPDDAKLETSGVPVPNLGTVPRAQLAALRDRGTATTPPVAKDAPRLGLVAVNRTLSLRALMLDGIPVAWLPSSAEIALPELQNGAYTIGWRDFFGSLIEAPKTVTLPAKVVVGKMGEAPMVP
jgi:hypothetical protein